MWPSYLRIRAKFSLHRSSLFQIVPVPHFDVPVVFSEGPLAEEGDMHESRGGAPPLTCIPPYPPQSLAHADAPPLRVRPGPLCAVCEPGRTGDGCLPCPDRVVSVLSISLVFVAYLALIGFTLWKVCLPSLAHDAVLQRGDWRRPQHMFGGVFSSWRLLPNFPPREFIVVFIRIMILLLLKHHD